MISVTKEKCFFIALLKAINRGLKERRKSRKVITERMIAPAGFWPRVQNPRRHPRSPRVYTYKDKEYLLKK